MRKIIIFGTLAALFGFAALAQAGDRSRAETGEGTQLARVAANDSREDRRGRDARADQSHEHRDESGDKRHDARKDHHEDPAAEQRDRR